ncbi:MULTISPECIES: hypothetical protein [Vibrio]|uniref:Uncharacterized protein n=1 Tax=Vibrio tasmaniensis TaxID=212663 RepID=A0A2N7NNA0_9VIBR|nr:hypothetical protein [Vibrio tasmaniensis]PMO89901.1 hypothetical protein BCT01_01055 [Vibrio tasmaniensis]PMP17768.1 hypothetical protein BCS92_05010 [Vibrio tasmaniensis]TKG28006.1 hypothetical protein FC057_22730 [Vibrio tasmaniensis]TKG41629.1 hypothetical protein FC063_07140 [Vibrio tasmaniensis]TKG44873.1 hypothetical protein FC061_20275 [Vibrio tasmaniensis]
MNDFKNKFKTATAQRTFTPRLNRAVRVSSYDLTGDSYESHFVIGKDLITKQEVKISLTPQSTATASGHSRLELAQIADPTSGKVHVAVGGILIFENCRMKSGNHYISDWSNAVQHHPEKIHETISMGYSTVVLQPSRLDPRNANKPMYNTAFVRRAETNKAMAFSCSSTKELFRFIQETLTLNEGEGGKRPEAIIRYVDRTEGEVDVGSVIITAPTEKVEQENQLTANRVCDAAKTMRYLFAERNDDTHSSVTALQLIFEHMAENPTLPIEQFMVEVIPVVRRNFGSEKRKSFFELVDDERSGGTVKRNARSAKGKTVFSRYHIPRTNGEYGYDKVWLPSFSSELCAFDTVMNQGVESRQPKDYRFIRDIFTTDVFPKGFETDYLPTKNYSDNSFMVERYKASTNAAQEKPTNNQRNGANQHSVQQQQVETVSQAPNQQQTQSTHVSQYVAEPALIGDTTNEVSEDELFGELTEMLNRDAA